VTLSEPSQSATYFLWAFGAQLASFSVMLCFVSGNSSLEYIVFPFFLLKSTYLSLFIINAYLIIINYVFMVEIVIL
jgi:hypothetical protein